MFAYVTYFLLFSSACTDSRRGGTQLSVSSKVGGLEKGHPLNFEGVCLCDHLLNSTTEVVTFHLRGWCMLGVFLLRAFIHLGHECQDLLSLYEGMHVCTDMTLVYTLI